MIFWSLLPHLLKFGLPDAWIFESVTRDQELDLLQTSFALHLQVGTHLASLDVKRSSQNWEIWNFQLHQFTQAIRLNRDLNLPNCSSAWTVGEVRPPGRKCGSRIFETISSQRDFPKPIKRSTQQFNQDASSSWWFQPIWKILVKLDHFGVKIKNVWNHHLVFYWNDWTCTCRMKMTQIWSHFPLEWSYSILNPCYETRKNGPYVTHVSVTLIHIYCIHII